MVPADQRLGPGDLAGRRRNRAAGRRPTAGRRPRARRAGRARRPGGRGSARPSPRRRAVAAAPVGLGLVERDVGLAGQLDRVEPVLAGQRDADADADEDLAAAISERLRRGLDDAPAQSASVSATRGDVGLDDRRTRRRRGARPCRWPGSMLARRRAELADQLVAGRMAERVVDLLEAVEIEVEQSEAVLGGAPDIGQRVVEPIVEQGAVGQAGQRVVEGQVLALRPCSSRSSPACGRRRDASAGRTSAPTQDGERRAAPARVGSKTLRARARTGVQTK